MDDLISRQTAIDALMPIYKSASLRNRNVFSTARKCMVTIEELPSAQPKHKGEWIRNFNGDEWHWFCSNCKEEWYEEDLWMGGNDFPNFCPNCGRDLRP